MITVAEWYRQGRNSNTPKVSVATITYGHEAFIDETIQGVLNQQVDFPVEMVIGEDCSPDRTREIILGYMERFPGFIKLSDYPQNIGAGENFQTTVRRCQGDYVALLDGDDFWTSPSKLQRQVELMEARPDVSMCFHKTNLVHNGKVVVDQVEPRDGKPTYTLADMANWIYIATSSMLYRRTALSNFPSWYGECFFGDFVLKVLFAEQGDVAYLPELMGSRRLHGGSIWLGQNPKASKSIRLHLETLHHICRHLPADRVWPFERERRRLYYRLVHAYADEGERSLAIQALRDGYRESGYDPKVERLEPIRSLLHLYAPPVYRSLRELVRRRRRDNGPVQLKGI